MVSCQVPTAEYADFAQPCGLQLGLTSVVCVPGLWTSHRLSHYPECVASERPAHPNSKPRPLTRITGSPTSNRNTVRTQPPLRFCSPSPWFSTCRALPFRGLTMGSCQAMAPQVTWRSSRAVILCPSVKQFRALESPCIARAHTGRQGLGPFTCSDSASKSIGRAVSPGRLVLLPLHLCCLSEHAGMGRRVSMSLGYSIRQALSTFCNTGRRRSKPA